MKDVPGCFSAASVFAHDSNVCKACQVFEECSQASLKTLEAIKGIINVSDLLKRHEAALRLKRQSEKPQPILAKVAVSKAEDVKVDSGVIPKPEPITKPVIRVTPVEKVSFGIPVEHELILATLPTKPRNRARILCSNGLIEKIKEGLHEGRNALAGCKPQCVSIAIDGLVAGGYSRGELKELFLNGTDMNHNTAASRVSSTLPILFGFGIAQEIGGRIVAAPNLVA